MSQNNDYITIAEFANRAGITKQRIYQLLNKSLKQFVKEIDGKKMLDTKALERYTIKEDKSNFNNNLNNTLNDTIQALTEQLAIKDKQIAELTKLLDQQQQLQAGSMKQLAESETETTDTKRSFWKRLFIKDA